MVGPTCKQCEAKIDPLLLNPQRSTTDPERAASAAGSCSTATHSVQSAGGTSCGAVLPARTALKKRLSFGRKAPPPDSAEVRRQESLANVKKAMSPDWYPKKKKRRSRPRKLTARNAKYIEQKKQQKSRNW
ncbi:hypothetical protein GN244_ATG09390 [Phytophthora infestans]|uniref:Uncharacterized protein n=1 Tax=Phytophthora infestans TaxID=4787 RepID=A0A833TC59_PHYIN|nr:hypothetical protein GN244_ATG09390 [Phytophthora infestans]